MRSLLIKLSLLPALTALLSLSVAEPATAQVQPTEPVSQPETGQCVNFEGRHEGIYLERQDLRLISLWVRPCSDTVTNDTPKLLNGLVITTETREVRLIREQPIGRQVNVETHTEAEDVVGYVTFAHAIGDPYGRFR